MGEDMKHEEPQEMAEKPQETKPEAETANEPVAEEGAKDTLADVQETGLSWLQVIGGGSIGFALLARVLMYHLVQSAYLEDNHAGSTDNDAVIAGSVLMTVALIVTLPVLPILKRMPGMGLAAACPTLMLFAGWLCLTIGIGLRDKDGDDERTAAELLLIAFATFAVLAASGVGAMQKAGFGPAAAPLLTLLGMFLYVLLFYVIAASQDRDDLIGGKPDQADNGYLFQMGGGITVLIMLVIAMGTIVPAVGTVTKFLAFAPSILNCIALVAFIFVIIGWAMVVDIGYDHLDTTNQYLSVIHPISNFLFLVATLVACAGLGA